MKYLNILYKNNSTPISISFGSASDAQIVFRGIMEERKNTAINSYLIKSKGVDRLFVDPSEISHCEISEVPHGKPSQS